MEIRLSVLPEEANAAIAAIGRQFGAVDVAGPYPNRRGRDGEVRYYLRTTGPVRWASEPGAP